MSRVLLILKSDVFFFQYLVTEGCFFVQRRKVDDRENMYEDSGAASHFWSRMSAQMHTKGPLK